MNGIVQKLQINKKTKKNTLMICRIPKFKLILSILIKNLKLNQF